jgi:hypothetical protein
VIFAGFEQPILSDIQEDLPTAFYFGQIFAFKASNKLMTTS